MQLVLDQPWRAAASTRVGQVFLYFFEMLNKHTFKNKCVFGCIRVPSCLLILFVFFLNGSAKKYRES